MSRILGLFATGLSLVALFLVLTRAAGASQIIRALSGGSVRIFRTLQGR